MAFSGFIDAIRHAADRGDRGRQINCKWTILGTDMQPVRSSSGATVAPWERLGSLADYEYLVVVGGLTSGLSKVERKVVDFVRSAYDSGTTVVGLCTGSFLLARAGIFNSSRCCVHHFHTAEFRSQFPSIRPVADKLFIDSGRVITCAGGCGVVDLALHLVERHFSTQVAKKVAGQMVYSQWRSHNHPQPPTEGDLETDVADPLVRRALYVLNSNIGAEVTIPRLAEQLGVGARSLTRHFVAELGVSPALYLRRMRIELAHWMLTNTERSISEVAVDCGFCDVSHLTRTFRSIRGSTPSASRKISYAKAADAKMRHL